VGATALAALVLAPPLLGSAIWHHRAPFGARYAEKVAPSQAPEFVARGTSDWSGAPHLMIYRLGPNHPPELVGGVINRSDELAFAYTNPQGLEHLMIFGVDEHRHMYWYHPAWSNEGENPVGIAVATGPEVHELAEAVSQRLDGRILRIIGLFTRDNISVKQVERVVNEAPAGAVNFPQSLDGALQIETVLEVEQ
jgi:hypothetical protein